MPALWPATLHTSEDTWDLTGTTGIAFYWWGTGDAPEIRVDFILESPTGFWMSSFYDGPARWRLVFLPWGSFTWVSLPAPDLDPHRHGFNEPDKSQIDAFYWTLHTPGVRRIDLIYAPVGAFGGNLLGEFIVRHADSVEFVGRFDGQVSLNLLGEFEVGQGSIELLGFFKVQAKKELPAEFTVRHSSSRELKAGFDSQASLNLSAEFTVTVPPVP